LSHAFNLSCAILSCVSFSPCLRRLIHTAFGMTSSVSTEPPIVASFDSSSLPTIIIPADSQVILDFIPRQTCIWNTSPMVHDDVGLWVVPSMLRDSWDILPVLLAAPALFNLFTRHWPVRLSSFASDLSSLIRWQCRLLWHPLRLLCSHAFDMGQSNGHSTILASATSIYRIKASSVNGYLNRQWSLSPSQKSIRFRQNLSLLPPLLSLCRPSLW
jgi:hypothetical protein